MPPSAASLEVHDFVYERLTAREQAILRRLRRGQWPRRGAAPTGAQLRRAARRNRRTLEALGINDLRNLLRIVAEFER